MITPRSPRWLSLARSEALQRMALAEKGNALFPSVPVTPAFSVRQSSSDAATRGLESLRISPMGDGLMTAKGVPPPSCRASWKCGSGGDFSESCNDG